jgi:hypothetical protein
MGAAPCEGWGMGIEEGEKRCSGAGLGGTKAERMREIGGQHEVREGERRRGIVLWAARGGPRGGRAGGCTGSAGGATGGRAEPWVGECHTLKFPISGCE